MPYDDPDAQDPMMLVGVEIDCADDSATQAMAESFVVEFLQMGLSPEEVLGLFQQSTYAAAHQAYQTLGEAAICELIDSYSQVLRPVRIIDNPRATTPFIDGSFPV